MVGLDYIFNSLLANRIESYEERKEQLEMAYSIEKALKENNILIVEAGTGIGKSLAYLIPLILWAGEDKQVIVSTYTKTLQNQLLKRDIPLIKSATGVAIKATIALGGENYLCKRRFKNLLSEGLFLPFQQDEIDRLLLWQKSTRTGLKAEAERDGRISVWGAVSRTQNSCIGKLCKERPRCCYGYSRHNLTTSSVIITNHHLFFANLSCGGMLLPKYDAVIFDEAHNLEEVATSYLGESVTNQALSYLIKEIGTKKLQKMAPIIEAVRTEAEDFFKTIKERFHQPITRVKQRIEIETDKLFINLDKLAKTLSSIETDDEQKAELSNLAERIKKIQNVIDHFIGCEDPDSIYWIEMNRNRVALKISPMDISSLLCESVFNGKIPAVLCSATMATLPGDFKYLKEKLGISCGASVSLPSPFDYENNTVLYIPENGPDPRDVRYKEFLIEEIEQLIAITEGRTFILFTSYNIMDKVYESIASRAPDYNLLKQGDISRDALLEKFRQTKRAVLFGVSTFWQGIDVPGDSLISVIITKLPFEVPTEPVIEARIEKIRENGGNPFLSRQLPEAILTLKQGYGRLIRKKTDYGMIAILDIRIRKKYYGRFFLSAIPDSKLTSSVEDVRQFFRNRGD